MLDVVLTREDANTEFALLAAWLVGDSEPVTLGQPVCIIETTKATVEVASPGDGTLVHLFDADTEVELGGVVALVAESDAELLEARARRQPAEAPVAEADAKATRRARELAERHGIDLGSIDKRGFITAADVEALLSATSPGATVPQASSLLASVEMSGVTLPRSWAEDVSGGKLDAAFLESLRADPASFRRLPSDEKCQAYREHGAEIGEGVELGEGSLLIAPHLIIEEGVELGPRSSVECAEAFCVGRLTHVGPDLELRCRRAFVGANVHAGRSIRIGGGGHRDPWAIIAIGDLAFLGDEIFVNVCRPVLIGRETFVTQRSMIVTHNIGHSMLEGYENRFAPVVVEDYAQVGLGAVVYAGCRIGQRAIVASNSYVVSDIPAGKLAIGVPARPAGEVRVQLSDTRRAELAHQMLDDYYELLLLREHEVSWLADSGARCFSVVAAVGSGQVAFVESLERADQLPEPATDGESVVMTLAFDADAPPEGWVVLDLVGRRVVGEQSGTLVDSTREFCRKRGIRFEGPPWRYGGGLT